MAELLSNETDDKELLAPPAETTKTPEATDAEAPVPEAPAPDVTPKTPKPFDYSELQGVPVGYVPLPTNVVGRAEGSLWSANFKQSITYGSFMNSTDSEHINQESDKKLTAAEIIDRIPSDLVLNYADRYIGKNPRDFDQISEQIRGELADKQLMAEHPWKSFGIGLLQQPFDPVNWLPIGELFSNVKRGVSLTRAMVGSGTAVATGTAIQEAILQRTQLTREAQESVVNVAVSGVIGAALGGIGTGLTIRGERKNAAQVAARAHAYQEVKDVYTETDKQLSPKGILKDEDIAMLPEPVRKAMNITPMNRLLNSDFDTAKFFANAMYEHNYTLLKHADERTGGASVETLNRLDIGKTNSLMVEYQKIFYEMNGINSGPFKGTRAKLQDMNMPYDDFNEAVTRRIITQSESPFEHVNRAAKLLEDKLFNPTRDRAVELGMLPEGVTPKNALGYIMSVYNKNKIIEEGGKFARGPGTFPQMLHEKFTEIQEQIKQFKDSPVYKEAKAKIDANKKLLKGPSADEKKAIDKRISPLKKSIKDLESRKAAKPKEEIKKINEAVRNLSKKKKQLQSDIIQRQKEYLEPITNELKSFKDELVETKKKVKPKNTEIQKLETLKRRAKERQLVLQERIKAKKEGTKTHKNITDQLSKNSSVIAEIEKNIKSVVAERESIKPTVKDIQADIQRMEKLAKLEAKEVPELKEQIEKIDSEVKELQGSKRPTKDEIKNLEKEIVSLREKINTIEKEKILPKKEARRLEEEVKELEKSILEAAPAKALNSDGELFDVVDSDTLWSHVEQTVDNILGDNDGKMLNPILDKLKGDGASPLKSRKMTVDQSDLLDWQIKDVSKLVHMYSRAMHPMLNLTEFAQKMGVKDLTELRQKFSQEIMKEFDEKVKGKTGKAATQLRKKRDAALDDMKATIELIQGVYGDGPNVLNDSARNFYQNFLKWNYIRLLGYMTLSSMADAGMQVFVHGPYRFIHEGLVQSFSGVRNIAKRDLRAIGYALETELGTRIKSYTEHQGLSTNPGPFTKALDSMTQGFGNLSLMNPWNDWQQSMAGHIGINRTLQTIHKVMKGEKISQIETERVIKLGLDKKHWKTIYEFTKNNDSDGTLFADWTNWNIKNKEQAEALRQFQASVAKEIDNIVIVPGLGDKPLTAHEWYGKLLFQFKTFLMAATNRVTVSGIQRRHDINTYLGVISMLGMGALSYVVTSLVRGNEPDLSFENLSREAVDKSGVLGIWGELGNIAAKPLGFSSTSRYASRDTVGALIGPSAGAISEVLDVLRSVSDSVRGEFDESLADSAMTTKDAQKLLRLAPYQNLFYLHQLNRKATRGLALELGAIDNE